MIRNYTGNSLPLVAVLRHSSDAGKADGILECLQGHGFRLCILDENAKTGRVIKKSCAVIAVLSESFGSSSSLADALITADGTGREIIPANIDDSVPDESLNRAFRARNSVFRSRYGSDEEFASRLLTADSLKEPFVTDEQKRAAKILTIGSAAAAIAVALAVVFGLKGGKSDSPEPEITPEPVNEFEQYINVVLAGDELLIGNNIWDVCTDDYDDNGNRVWRVLEDGRIVEASTSSDLSFLQYMTNLRTLVLVNQTATELPDLSGLTKLERVELWECDLSDLRAFYSCPNIRFMHVTANVTDMSQFSGIKSLVQLDLIDDYGPGIKSLDGFTCDSLQSVQLISETLSDISGLAGCPKLKSVQVNAQRVRDFSVLGNLNKLEDLILENCEGCRDLSCLFGCEKLKHLTLQDLWNLNGDLSCLENHKDLYELNLFCRLDSLDFLKTIPENRELNLGFCDNLLNDFEGLSALKRYGKLHVNLSGRSYGLVEQYLQGVTVENLQLYNCSDIDPDKLPRVVSWLEMINCNITSLEGLQADLSALRLDNLPRLSSLNGIEDTKISQLAVTGCPRLYDWEPVYGHRLVYLELNGTYTTPDFSRMGLTVNPYLMLIGIPELEDLSFLNSLKPDTKFSELTILSDSEFVNLKPLEQMKGMKLVVSPMMEDQAKDLVDKGVFSSYEIRYDNLDWIGDADFTLTSPEELEILPDALLARVSRLNAVGDIFVDNQNGEYWENVDQGRSHYISVRYPDGSERTAGEGFIENLDQLQKLIGLKELEITAQPIQTLEGIQQFTSLEILNLCDLSNLNDISQAFALPGLKQLYLFYGHGVDSLEGIQNLRHLEELHINAGNDLRDYSPLSDLSGSLKRLKIDNSHGDEYIDCIKNMQLDSLMLNDSIHSQQSFEAICGNHPETSYLELCWNDRIEDLSPLLSMPNLTEVRISSDMLMAIASVDGMDLPFELEIVE